MARAGGRRSKVTLSGTRSRPVAGLVPTGAVAHEHTMRAGADPLADLGEVEAHDLAADPGHHDGRADRTAWTDRAEQPGGVVRAESGSVCEVNYL